MRPQIKLIATLTISTLAVACGGRAGGAYNAKSAEAGGTPDAPQPTVQQSYGQPGYHSAGGDDGDSVGTTSSAPAGAPAPPADEAEASPRTSRQERVAPEPERRGLATQWGETRESRITTSPFFRDDPSSPASVSKVFYNDRAGARAMAQRNGFVDLDSAEFSVAGGALTVSLRDSGGNPLPAFQAGGRNFAVGESGQRYSIHVTNHTGVRLEAVATVDGLDVIDGRDGSFSKRGYIVNPFSSLEIDGFRQSMDTVAAFRFGSVASSYAAGKGKARNVGVIGMAFFQERGSEWPWNGGEVRRRESADPFPARFAEPPRFR